MMLKSVRVVEICGNVVCIWCAVNDTGSVSDAAIGDTIDAPELRLYGSRYRNEWIRARAAVFS